MKRTVTQKYMLVYECAGAGRNTAAKKRNRKLKFVGEAWIQSIVNVVCVWIEGPWREEKWAMCNYEWNNNEQSAVKVLEMHVNKL